MIKFLFSNQSKTITGAALLLGFASFASRLIGLLRERIFTHYFGAGDILDAYYSAFRIPDFIYNLLIVGALSAGFIPIFMQALSKDKDESWKLTNNIINLLSISLAIVSLALFFLIPNLAKIIFPGFSDYKLELTISLTRIMLVSPIILGLSSIVGGVLQAYNNFLIFSLAPIMYNFGIIIGATVLTPIIGPIGLAYGVIIGAFLHLFIQLPALFKHGFKYQPIFDLKSKYIKMVGKLMIPRTIGLAAQQFNLIVITSLASTLGSGKIAIFNLANNLQYLPVGIIGYSFSIAAFPMLSKFAAENKKEEMIKNISATIKQIIFLIAPATVLFLLLRAQIVRVTLGSGKFDWDATITTADTLAFFVLSFFAQCLIPLLTRAFYALQNTWMPFTISLVSAFVNIILSIYLKNDFGILGLALAFSISSIIQMILLWLTLRKKTGTLEELSILQTVYKISIAIILMGLAVQGLKNLIGSILDMDKFWEVLSQGAISGTIGLLIYGAVCHILKVEEMNIFIFSLKKRWLKIGKDTVFVEEKTQ